MKLSQLPAGSTLLALTLFQSTSALPNRHARKHPSHDRHRHPRSIQSYVPVLADNITNLYDEFFTSNSNSSNLFTTEPLSIPGLPNWNPFSIQLPKDFSNPETRMKRSLEQERRKRKRGLRRWLPLPFLGGGNDYQAPGPTDQRGGCPGLNILANYGYIDRSGITNPAELLVGLFDGLGVSPDLGAILIGVGAVAGMDISTMKLSIGTQDSRTDGPLTNILGQGPGLFGPGSHNVLENDGSAAYEDEGIADPDHNGNHFSAGAWGATMQALEENGGEFNMAWAGRVRQLRQQQCISNNPTCYWGWKEIHLYMANMNANAVMPGMDPKGVGLLPPTYDRVSKFWGVSKNANGNYISVPNQFPLAEDGQWHKPLVPVTTPQFVGAGLAAYALHPTTMGGNSGKVNSFNADPLQWKASMTGNEVMCFLFNAVLENTPTQFEKSRDAMTKVINYMLAPARQAFSC